MYHRVVEKISVTKARVLLADIVNKVAFGNERVILDRAGKDVAAVISIENLRLLERLVEEEEDRIDIEEAKRTLAEGGKAAPYEEVRKELGLTSRAASGGKSAARNRRRSKSKA
jgi:prevent-host-death family protein